MYTCNDFSLGTVTGPIERLGVKGNTVSFNVLNVLNGRMIHMICITFMHHYEWTLVLKKRSTLLPAMVLP